MMTFQKFNMTAVLGVALAMSFTAGIAPAATITPVSATSPFVYFTFSPGDVRSPGRTIDSSGLNGFGEHVATLGDPQAWLADAAYYGLAAGPTIVWDLGQIYDLTSMHIWNYNETARTEEGIKDVNVFVSNDNSTFSAVGLYSLTSAPGLDTYTGDNYSLVTSGRYVKFDVVSTQNPSPFGPHAGLSEIRFEGSAVADTPEPSTFLLAGLSFGLAWCVISMKRAAVRS